MKPQNQKNKNKFDDFIRYSSLAFEMMAMIALGTYGGYKIDQWMDNEFKGFTLGLMVLSVIGSVVYATRKILKK
ncbi:MAG: AtpZ/AtpI family protein [Tangfeifania sp.]|nr:AtpZ/AtpI family protein [Tangfeifania sp.]